MPTQIGKILYAESVVELDWISPFTSLIYTLKALPLCIHYSLAVLATCMRTRAGKYVDIITYIAKFSIVAQLYYSKLMLAYCQSVQLNTLPRWPAQPLSSARIANMSPAIRLRNNLTSTLPWLKVSLFDSSNCFWLSDIVDPEIPLGIRIIIRWALWLLELVHNGKDHRRREKKRQADIFLSEGDDLE